MSTTPYDISKSYTKGKRVTLNGKTYEAKWWANPNTSPDAHYEHEYDSPWKEITTTTASNGSVPQTKPVAETLPKVVPLPDTTDKTVDTIIPEVETEKGLEITYGETWGTEYLTSSVQFLLSEDLQELHITVSSGTFHTLSPPWGASVTKLVSGAVDKWTFTKGVGKTYVENFGFNLSLGPGITFDTVIINECIFNGTPCHITFNHPTSATETTPGSSAVLPQVDPFPKKIATSSGKYVNITKWSPTGTTYKTFKRATYPSGSGNKEYLVGGYFTDWGVYQDFTPARLPINDINFIQIAFAAICGPGDESNCYGNPSATAEAKPKLKELCRGKPVGTLIILDHWSHYGKKDMNLPEFTKPYGEPAYHVEGYERGLNFLGIGTLDQYPIHNVGGVKLSGEGKLNYAYGIQEDFRSYNQVLNRNGRKFNMFLSIGGWTLSDPFPVIAANATYRQNFINSVIAYLMINPHINGIDIDWEFVGVDGATVGIMGSRDSNNFTKLMYELQVALMKLGYTRNSTIHLSAAIGTTPKHLEKIHWGPTVIDGKPYPGMKTILDHIFLMSYDYYGPWNGVVGHQAALYTNGENVGYSADSAVQYLKNAGVPSRKIILGVAAYGRIWANVQKSQLNLSEKYEFPNHATGQSPGLIGTQAGVVFWHHLKRVAYNEDGSLKDGFRYVRDEKAKAEFLIYEDTERHVNFVTSIDTPYSVAEKGRYVKTQNLGGIFYWSLDNDNGDLLNGIHEGLGSELKSDTLEPNYRENSLLLYRAKEANYYTNANVIQDYALSKIFNVIGNIFTFGGLGIVQSITSLLQLGAVMSTNKSVNELTDEEWEEYVQLLKTVDNYGGSVADLTVDAAKKGAESAGLSIGYAAADVLFSGPMLLGMGMDAGLMDVIQDAMFEAHGGDYSGRIIRDTMDPWAQMRKDFPSININY